MSYRFRRISFGASGKWTDATPMTSTGVIVFRKGRTMIDLNGAYPLSSRLGVFFQARNLFNIEEYRYQVDPAYPTMHTKVGTFHTFGIKGAF